MAKRKRAEWLRAAWALAASGCTTIAGLDGDYHPPEGQGGASGSTGSLSSTSGGGEVLPAVADMIDDMEDGDNAINDAGGREGYWYSFNDGTETAMQTPPAAPGEEAEPFTMTTLDPARLQSTTAACTQGSGFTAWGAAIGFDLNNPYGVKMPYDGSAHRGITFWARIAAGTADRVKVMISDGSTAPEGGHCDPDGIEPEMCNDNWADTLTLSDRWEQHAIAFEDLVQGQWGAEPLTPTLDATAMYSVQLLVDPSVDFDFCIDDIGFYD
ncbi:uncharacterized protein SOCE26_082470 [Sorangium cellulosum]|uniref:Uncharacterized protein n=1 Tax=Sorangium cellulosum TaxID=56 RepID=A0A2L0F563_SORCE|nr:carbohydrate binding domain-containing protein [Sorangium cellulosum]AUX46738.1 uncharacterized protein SOCE26_082470 [Sorangium cellulosum]